MGKLEIVEAAGLLFSERGYDTTSMRDIAKRVGVKAGSLYSHIENKQELLYIIVNGVSDRFLAAIEPLVSSSEPAEERLREVVHRHLRLMVDHLDVATVFLHERRGLSPDQHAEVLAKRHRYEASVVQIIEQGMADGVFETSNSKLAGTTLLSILNWSYTWYDPRGKRTPDEIADFVADFVIRSLRPSRSDESGGQASLGNGAKK